MSENKIAVINSKSFGRYFPEQIERLEAAGGLISIEISIQILTVKN